MKRILRRIGRLARSRPGIAVLVVLAAGAGAGVAALVHGSGGTTHTKAVALPPVTGSRARSFLALVIPPPAGALPGTDIPNRVAKHARALPLQAKVAQIMMVGFSGPSSSSAGPAITGLDVGGVALDKSNFQNTAQLASLVRAIRIAFRRGRADPPFILAPQIGGEFNAFPSLPPADAPADLGSVSLAATETADAAKALSRAGLNGALAPTLDVGPPDGQAAGGESFSQDPDRTSAYAVATVRAWRRAGLLAVASSFPGLGSANQSTDNGPAAVRESMSQVSANDLPPFRAAIRTGVPAVLLSLAAYEPDDFVTPAALSQAIATDLLRGQLGFRGVSITDDLTSAAVTALMSVPQAAVEAVQAGADMVWISGPPSVERQAYSALLSAARSGKISTTRLNDAVIRILAVKSELGLASKPLPKVPKPAVPGVTTGP